MTIQSKSSSNSRQTTYPFRRDSDNLSDKRNIGNAEAIRLQHMMSKQFANKKTGPDYTRLQSKSEDLNQKLLEQKQKEYEEEQRIKNRKKMTAKEAREKAVYARNLKAFLKQSDEMLLDKFFVVHSEKDFMSKLQQKTELSDITGIYIICNTIKRKVYIGKNNNAFDACWQVFRDKSVSRNYIATIKDDFDEGDQMVVNFVRLRDTNYDTIDELESAYVERYNSIQDGYNSKLGAKPKRHWYAYN